MSKIGTLYIIAAPSGAGKTSLVKAITSQIKGLEVSVSHTTRPARPNDVDGVDYHFIDDNQFNRKVANQEFLEHALVFGHQYGTCKQEVLEKIKQGIDIILEIDWQGARQIRQIFSNSVGIYIFPPSFEALRRRLVHRNEDDGEVIDLRMQQAASEMSHYHEFDYLVVNDDFDIAVNDLSKIIKARQLRTAYQSQVATNILEQNLKTR